MIIKSAMLGTGIYTISEAAQYARVKRKLLYRWLFGPSDRFVIHSQYDPQCKVVSFLDLVQTLAIREIRRQKKVSLGKIRQAIEIAQAHHKMPYPFAMQHYIWLRGDDLVIGRSQDDLIQASGRNRGNRVFSFVQSYLKNLSFNSDGLANQFQAFRYNEITINMNPELRFGEPLLPSGYSAKVIRNAIGVEGGIEDAAKAYGITEQEVWAAYKFYDYLGTLAA
jgi:hypothetical protein